MTAQAILIVLIYLVHMSASAPLDTQVMALVQVTVVQVAQI